MRKLWPILLLAGLLLVIAFTPAPAFLSFRFMWDVSTNDLDPNLSFNIYGTNQLSTNLIGWPIFTNLAYTNLTASNSPDPTMVRFYWSFTTPVQQMFFFDTASNYLSGMESGPGLPVTNTPPIPRPSILHLTR